MRVTMSVLFIVLIQTFTCAMSIKEWFVDITNSVVDTVQRTGCKYVTCCEDHWTNEDFSALQTTLRDEVYGQNIMIDIVVPALRGHLMPNSPSRKALALSFHGRPGIGKNYVATFIQNMLFHKRYHNRHVHFFTGRIHFPLESEASRYKVNLLEWIRGNVSKCGYSLFIFDEVDKMPPTVLDAVKPYLDYYETIDGIDFRKSIFIFISNTGGDLIAKEYLKYWKRGKKRDNLRLSDFEDLIRIGAFNERGGFYRSDAIESSLIDHYIPFLPLEEEHIRKCIHDEFKKRKAYPQQSLVNEIMSDITFGPEENPIFSNGGCKRIAPKVSAAIERKHFGSSTFHHEL